MLPPPGVPPLEGGGVPVVGPTIVHVNNCVMETPTVFVAAAVTK